MTLTSCHALIIRVMQIQETGTGREGESEMHKRFGKIPAGQKTGLKTKLN